MVLKNDYDYVIVGSGFGGSVSALRLAEKGYSVLIIEKGKDWAKSDFPKNNWNLRKWLWLPELKCFGIQQMSVFRHLSIVSGVGVGGGSLVYANTLPRPKSQFFNHGSWAKLMDWETELTPYYKTAWKMLGAATNTKMFAADHVTKQVGEEMGIADTFKPTEVSVHFGTPGKTVKDPYFGGKGPDRTGCIHCGECMTGCRHNAKNTLDKNYLHLARQLGVDILAEHKVKNVIPLGKTGELGYDIEFSQSTKYFSKIKKVRSKGIVFSAGVLGTVNLLLHLKEKTLPNLSEQLGQMVRSNNESLIFATANNSNVAYSEGLAIGSILELDENTHVEPTRYGTGSGLWRLGMMPMVSEANFFKRMIKLVIRPLRDPINWLKVFFVKDFGKSSTVLLIMQHLDSTLRFEKGVVKGLMKSSVKEGEAAPSAFIPEAHAFANKFAKIIKGKTQVIATESITGLPSTAHILGGCVMGEDTSKGVIDTNNRVFGYKNMYVFDGSMISANPGVNPSLTITAISERGMSKIVNKGK